MKNVAVDRDQCLAEQPLPSGDLRTCQLYFAPGDAGTGHLGTNNTLQSAAYARFLNS
jgi:hypothetical protein